MMIVITLSQLHPGGPCKMAACFIQVGSAERYQVWCKSDMRPSLNGGSPVLSCPALMMLLF